MKTKEKKQKKELGKYFPSEIEKKWQEKWAQSGIHRFAESNKKKKYYTLVELPYPSGDLHIGHWFTFVAPDVLSRLKKMQGYNVFFPMGYDAFGLPAENAAIKRNIHPKDWTEKNIETMTKQFETMGTMIDWDHVTITCKPEYFTWNQWIFQKMFEKGIAYRGKTLSNWCPTDQTVLANEHVENGKCWRCGTVVVQKEVEQWFLKITDYAEKLLWNENGNGVDWPKSVMTAQNEWIGKKEGIEITYDIEDSNEKVTVFTTRPDTNFGATFIAIAPENQLVGEITTPEQMEEVEKYVTEANKKTELQRMEEGRQKSGVFTGRYAINHLTGYKMPIWVSDFVLINFGTGALVGVPGHDKRDFEFAEAYGLDVKRVVVGEDGDTSPIESFDQVQEEEGTMINSDFLNGMDIHAATKKMMEYIEEKGWGKRVTTYHLHDWSVSRQRYWGTPVPMIDCPKCGIVPVPEKDLPVTLPYDVDYQPKGKAPLASNDEWMRVTCPSCGGEARRDPETLDTFFDSAWYYYRYVDPNYTKGPFESSQVAKLMPLDIYFGGGEHTLGHTLYARFFTKFFKDLGMVGFDEFALKRVQHGIVLGPDGNKMSKSKGNVINPDDLVKEFGTDAVRIYLSFMMPYAATGPWATGAMYGMFRFLKRVWDLQGKIGSENVAKKDLLWMHRTAKKVGEDIAGIKFNTAVSELMKWLNYLEIKQSVTEDEYKWFLVVLSPFAPHITEEIWQSMFGNAKAFHSIHQESWPQIDEKNIVEDQITIIVQVNGRVRDTLQVTQADSFVQTSVETVAKESEKVKKYLVGEIRHIVFVPGKIINFVV
ncbi:MAG: leucine--tRNA ligase [Candidatus Levyibacteriota bacterium]